MNDPGNAEKTYFAPYLFLRNVAAGIEFYKAAFDAVELRRWSNDDGTIGGSPQVRGKKTSNSQLTLPVLTGR